MIYGSKAVGEPPLMLALSVREAIRAAIAAFGQPQAVPLPSPTTPEVTLRAIEAIRSDVNLPAADQHPKPLSAQHLKSRLKPLG